jgi:chemotaxis protein CheY-P-specific phosphatase CheC
MKRLQTDLFRTGLHVFEDLGFLLPSAEINEEQAAAQLQTAVSAEFSGPIQGMILLTLSGPVLPILTANMLGEESPTTQAQEMDALKEVCNVICGNLLPSLINQDAVFDIHPPQIRNLNCLESIRQLPSIHQAIGLEDGRADIWLFLPEEILKQEA